MVDYPDDPYADDLEFEEIDLKFELLNSQDYLTITLVCSSSQELCPYDYARALRTFADRVEALTTISEADMNVVN